MNQLKTLAREPALVTGFVISVAAVLCGFVFHVTSDQQGAIVAALSLAGGLWTAYLTRDGQVAAILGLAKAVLSLAVSFGWHLDSGRQALLMTVVASAVSMFVRTQVGAPVAPASPVTQVPATPTSPPAK